MTKYTTTTTVTRLTPGKAIDFDFKGVNHVKFVVDQAAATNGFSVNGAELPAGVHTFGAPDAYGVMEESLKIEVPAVACIVSQIVTYVKFLKNAP